MRPSPTTTPTSSCPSPSPNGRRRCSRTPGSTSQDPPEDWLTKVVSGGSFVDVIWRTCGHPVESDLIDRSEMLPVLSVHMPVLRATDIVVTKLMALDEHYCDFSRMLPVARALREQVDWDEVRREVADNDFAVVFLQLLERLRVLPDSN